VKHRGFTLVELLVVIAIIALLVTILLPVLSKASGLTKRAMCLSNLHNMAVAAQQYAAGNNGRLPQAYSYPPGDPTYFAIFWDFRYQWDGTIEAGLLWDRGEDQKIQQCPSFEGSANSSGDKYTGYNYNTSYLGHGDMESIPTPASMDDVKRAAGCAIFGDGESAGGANKFMRAPFPNPGDSFMGRYAGTQGFRHVGETTSVSYCDGHAAAQAERYTEISPSYQQANIAEGTGFLSPDNSVYDLE